MRWLTVFGCAMWSAIASAGPVEVGSALNAPKSAKWDAKGKALDPYVAAGVKRKQKAWHEAAELLVQALEKQPGCGRCLRDLGTALAEYGQKEDGMAAARLLVELYPDREEVWAAAYDVAFTLEEWTPALEFIDHRISMDPDDLDAHLDKQEVLLMTADYTGAEEALSAASELEEADRECMRVKLQAARGDAAGSRSHWEACEASEQKQLKYAAEGWLALAEGDLHLAAKRSTDVRDANQTRMNLALLRIEEGKRDAALNLLAKTLEEQPDALDARVTRAQILASLGRTTEARTELEEQVFTDGWEAHAKDPRRAVLKARGAGWVGVKAQEGAALLAELRHGAGSTEEALLILQSATAVLGEHEVLTAARAAIEGEKAE